MPLVVDIVDETLRDRITVGHQALQHHGIGEEHSASH
jgi:hypothetical protein